VRLRVNNTGKDTVMIDNGVFGFTAGVQLEPGGRKPDAGRSDPAKGTALTLQPRLPRDVDLVWKWTGAPPGRVTLDLHNWTRQLQVDRGGYYWSTGRFTPIVYTVTMPVRQGGGG
jgi:hypothetical protein